MVSLGEVMTHTSCSTFWSGIHVEDAVLLAQETQEAHNKQMDKEGAVSSESARSTGQKQVSFSRSRCTRCYYNRRSVKMGARLFHTCKSTPWRCWKYFSWYLDKGWCFEDRRNQSMKSNYMWSHCYKLLCKLQAGQQSPTIFPFRRQRQEDSKFKVCFA